MQDVKENAELISGSFMRCAVHPLLTIGRPHSNAPKWCTKLWNSLAPTEENAIQEGKQMHAEQSAQ